MSSEIFRDRSEGVNARRLELLRRRRDEFVLMPHAIRRVYVARRARSAASIAVWLMGIGMLVCAMSPTLNAYITRGMPGINPALLSTLVIAMWATAIVAYFVARARCEHHFSVAMSKTVLPSENPDADIDRLSHEHPDDVARGMAHRLEVRASAWPVAAAAMILPATLLYVAYGIKQGGWPAIAEYESSLALHAGKLVALGVFGTFAGLAMTHRALRGSSIAAFAAFATLAGPVLFFALGKWFAAFAIVTLSIAFVARTLRKERAMLETDDPAAGSELFTWRAFATSVMTTLESIGSKLNKRQGRIALIAGVATVATLGFVTGRRTHNAAPPPKASVAQVLPQQLVVNTDTGSSYKVTHEDSLWRVDVTLTNNDIFEIHFPAIDKVPQGWAAHIAVRTDSTPTIYATTSEQLDDMLHPMTSSFEMMTTSSCFAPMPLGLRVRGEPGTYTLYVRPVLEPAGC